MAVSIGWGMRSPSNTPWAISLPNRSADSRSRIAALVGARPLDIDDILLAAVGNPGERHPEQAHDAGAAAEWGSMAVEQDLLAPNVRPPRQSLRGDLRP